MKRHAFLLVAGLICISAWPAAAQQSWRGHVTAFTAKLYGQFTDGHNQRDYFWAKNWTRGLPSRPRRRHAPSSSFRPAI